MLTLSVKWGKHNSYFLPKWLRFILRELLRMVPARCPVCTGSQGTYISLHLFSESTNLPIPIFDVILVACSNWPWGVIFTPWKLANVTHQRLAGQHDFD